MKGLVSSENEKKEARAKGERDIVGQQHLAELQAQKQGNTTDNSRHLLHIEWNHSKDISGSMKPAGRSSVVLSQEKSQKLGPVRFLQLVVQDWMIL